MRGPPDQQKARYGPCGLRQINNLLPKSRWASIAKRLMASLALAVARFSASSLRIHPASPLDALSSLLAPLVSPLSKRRYRALPANRPCMALA